MVFTAILLPTALMAGSCQQNTSPNSSTPSGSSAAAEGNAKFFCDEDRRGTPTTYGTTNNGRVVPVVCCKSEYFKNSGWSPRHRCDRVSDKFVEAYKEGILKGLAI